MNNVNQLFAARYGHAASIAGLDEVGPGNDVLASILRHRSVRAYADKPLDPGTLPRLIAAAQSASSSSNLQAWSVVAVRDDQRKQRLSRLAANQAHIRRAPLFLVWLADLARLARVAERRGLPHDGLAYFELFLLAVIDAALAAQNAVLAAEALGLGTVYIGGIRNHPLEVAAELALPPAVFPVFGLCVGHPDPEQPTAIKPRLPQRAVLHHETYGDPAAQDAAVDDYDDVMAAFYEAQKMDTPGPWSIHSSKRVSGPGSLAGRDRLQAFVQALGFPLR